MTECKRCNTPTTRRAKSGLCFECHFLEIAEKARKEAEAVNRLDGLLVDVIAGLEATNTLLSGLETRIIMSIMHEGQQKICSTVDAALRHQNSIELKAKLLDKLVKDYRAAFAAYERPISLMILVDKYALEAGIETL